MEKITLDAHPSVVVACCPELRKFLFSVYDDGYPRKAYRGSANNIGGNPGEEDRNPESVLIREICEEFDPNHSEEKQYVGKVKWASDEDIRLIRNGLLAQIKPFQDILVRQEEVIEGGNKPYTAIYSSFYTLIPKEVIETVEWYLRDEWSVASITTEGNIGVYTLEQLANSSRGEFSTAHATAPVIDLWAHLYDLGYPSIPFPKQISAKPIGNPRKSFSEYLADFEYNNENLKKAAQAQDFNK